MLSDFPNDPCSAATLLRERGIDTGGLTKATTCVRECSGPRLLDRGKPFGTTTEFCCAGDAALSTDADRSGLLLGGRCMSCGMMTTPADTGAGWTCGAGSGSDAGCTSLTAPFPLTTDDDRSGLLLGGR